MAIPKYDFLNPTQNQFNQSQFWLNIWAIPGVNSPTMAQNPMFKTQQKPIVWPTAAPITTPTKTLSSSPIVGTETQTETETVWGLGAMEFETVKTTKQVTQDQINRIAQSKWSTPDVITTELTEKWYTIQQPEQTPVQEGKWVAKDVWIGIWGTIWWLAWLKGAGWWLENIGKSIYNLTLQPSMDEARQLQSYEAGASKYKPQTATDVALKRPLFQKWWNTLSSKLGQVWTRTMIGTQAEAAANNIFKDKVNPLFEQADQKWIKVGYKPLIDEAIENVNSSNKYSVTQKKEIIDDIRELGKDYIWETDLKNLDLEKQALANKLPKKYFNVTKVPQSLQNARWELSSVFRWSLHNNMLENFGEDTAKLYQEYASLKWLSEIGPKSRTQWWRKSGSWTLVSWVIDELFTPATTTAGKVLYKAGQAANYIPKQILKTTIKLGKWLLAIDPVNTPELLQYVPWTIGESFKEYIQENPASIAFQWLMDLGLSDKEIIKEIKDEYKIDDETAKKIYEWKLIVF